MKKTRKNEDVFEFAVNSIMNWGNKISSGQGKNRVFKNLTSHKFFDKTTLFRTKFSIEHLKILQN